jgi:cytidylate kinase
MKPSTPGDPYDAAHLIERQMLLRHARDRARQERTTVPSRLKYRFVTVSRDTGTGGDEIARMLAARLNWHVFDKEILDYVARNSHVRQNLVTALDERGESLIHDTVERFLRMAEGGSFGVEDYYESLVKALCYLADRGEAVIVGRGANFVLRHERDGLHVRLVGSAELRAERLADRWKIPSEEARRRMHQRDAARRAFIRHHFKQEIDDPHGYDLVFNTDHLSPEQVASSIAAAIASTAPLEGASAGSELHRPGIAPP